MFSTGFAQQIDNLFVKGDSLYELEKYEKAQFYFEKIIEIDQFNTKAYNKLSDCMASQGDVDSAISLLNTAVEIDPKYADGYAGLSTLYLLEDKVDTSIVLIKKARKLNPDTAIYPVLEGITYMYYKTLDTALTMFEIATEIDPNYSLANYYKSFVYESVEILDSALKYINIAIAQKDDEPDYYQLRAEIYYANYRYSDAMFEIDKALKLNPDNDEYLLAKAEVYLTLEQYRDVVRIALPHTKDGYNEDFYYYVILGYFNLDMQDSAMVYINKSRKFDPENDFFYYIEGYMNYSNKDYRNALLCFNAAIELNPDNGDYYYLSCYSQVYMNTDSTVLDYNENFYDLNIDNWKKMKKWSEAKNSKYYYQKLLAKFEFQPTTLSVDEYFMLYFGNALQDDFSGYSNSNSVVSKAFEDGDYEHCITVGKSFIEDHPTSINTYFYIANSYFMLGQTELSIKYLTVYYGYIQGILSTGDGETQETAYIVSSITDEYTLLRFEDYTYAGQELVNAKKHNFDVLSYMDGEVKRKMYFNIDLFFGKL